MNFDKISKKTIEKICDTYNITFDILKYDKWYIIVERHPDYFNGQTILLPDGQIKTIGKEDIKYSSFFDTTLICGINFKAYHNNTVKEVIGKMDIYRRHGVFQDIFNNHASTK